jgi:hypothetical protein
LNSIQIWPSPYASEVCEHVGLLSVMTSFGNGIGSTCVASAPEAVGPSRATLSIAATANQPIIRIADARVVRSPMDSSFIR